jgi:hypothetical protein
VTRPTSGLASPARIRIKVDFPLFGAPRIQIDCPGSKTAETFVRTS